MFLPHPRVKVSIVGSLRGREVASSASDRQGPNFESCVWRTVSSQSSHQPQEVLLAQFSLCAQRWPKARFVSFLLSSVIIHLINWLQRFYHNYYNVTQMTILIVAEGDVTFKIIIIIQTIELLCSKVWLIMKACIWILVIQMTPGHVPPALCWCNKRI